MVFGVVDEDYYGNIDNDGEIGFEFYNILDDAVTIKKGEKLRSRYYYEFYKNRKWLRTKNSLQWIWFYRSVNIYIKSCTPFEIFN